MRIEGITQGLFITSGMAHRMLSISPLSSIYSVIWYWEPLYMDILSPWRFCCKKETKPTSSTQIRQNRCLWPVQTTHITGFKAQRTNGSQISSFIGTRKPVVGRGLNLCTVMVLFLLFMLLYPQLFFCQAKKMIDNDALWGIIRYKLRG